MSVGRENFIDFCGEVIPLGGDAGEHFCEHRVAINEGNAVGNAFGFDPYHIRVQDARDGAMLR